MGNMFYESKNFNCNILPWNIGKVETMYRMFYKAERFRQDLCEWPKTYPSYFPEKVGTAHMFKESKCEIKNDPTDVNVCNGCFICGEEKERITWWVIVESYNYPVDITWKIFDEITKQPIYFGDRINEKMDTKEKKVQLCEGRAYRFIVEDSKSVGSSDPHFNVKLKNSFKNYHDRDIIGTKDVYLISNVKAESAAPSDSALPTSYPSVNPSTDAYTEEGTIRYWSNCTGDLKVGTIEIKTDYYPEETSWSLKNNTDKTIVSVEEYDVENKIYITKVEFCSVVNYTFCVEDSYGDGFTSSGYGKLFFDGLSDKPIVSISGKFTKKCIEFVNFIVTNNSTSENKLSESYSYSY